MGILAGDRVPREMKWLQATRLCTPQGTMLQAAIENHIVLGGVSTSRFERHETANGSVRQRYDDHE